MSEDRRDELDDANTPSAHGRQRLSYGVAGILVALALVPLLGLAVVVIDDIRTIADLRRRTEKIDASTARLTRLSALEASITDEMNWTSALRGTESFGFDATVFGPLAGVDAIAEHEAVTSTVDRLLRELDLEAAAATIGEVRLLRNLEELNTRYTVVREEVASLRLDELVNMRNLASGVENAERLSVSIALLAEASEARQAVAVQLTEYFGARFGLLSNALADIEVLIRQRDTYDAAITSLQAQTSSGSDVNRLLVRIALDADLVHFRTVIDELVDERLLTGEPEQTSDFTVLLPILDELAAIFSAWSTASELHLELVNAAGADVLVAADDVRQGAQADTTRALLIIGSVAIVTLIAAAVATQLIVKPLHRLRQTAHSLRDGRPVVDGPRGGPSEVRAAAGALNDAAGYLDLASRQAAALATGRLDAPELMESGPGELGASLQGAVQTLAESLAQQQEYRSRLAHEASHDALTRLPNRKASMEQLAGAIARAARADTTVAVLFIDLDEFKDVNDQHGHHAGDMVLRTVAARLTDCVRDGDHVGRLGGDEFVVIAEPIADIDTALVVASRIVESLSSPIDVGQTRVSIGASVGVGFAEDDRLTADELLRDADLAVYKAKAAGRGTIEICDEDLRAQMLGEADLSAALELALANDEFELLYQPIVTPHDGDLHGFEALIRWRRPGVSDLVQPDYFLPFAQRSELIVNIDRWVLRRVAAQIEEWRGHAALADAPIAINISPRFLASGDFVSDVLTAFESVDLTTGRISLELTESALLEDLQDAAAKLQVVRAAGIRIAIDDFGTGYTSLAHLRSLPVDVFKIDRSFAVDAATDPAEASIVGLIIDTGHLLGATIVAEGIETTAQADALTALGSDTLQGFLFAKPQSPEELGAALSRQP